MKPETKAKWTEAWTGQQRAEGDLPEPADRSQGWKADPVDPERERYWNGTYWTTKIQGDEPPVAEPSPEATRSGRESPADDLDGPGWYPDPEQAHTVRYWDGRAWTDQRAPATGRVATAGRATALAGPLIALLTLAVVGAIVAIVGVFLPEADTDTGIHIGKNTLIQHPEGIIVIGLAIASVVMAVIAAFNKAARGLLALVFLGGAGIVFAAVVIGTNLPVEPINQLSERLLKVHPASAGAGVWAVGVGGVLLACSALFGIEGKWGGKSWRQVMYGSQLD